MLLDYGVVHTMNESDSWSSSDRSCEKVSHGWVKEEYEPASVLSISWGSYQCVNLVSLGKTGSVGYTGPLSSFGEAATCSVSFIRHWKQHSF